MHEGSRACVCQYRKDGPPSEHEAAAEAGGGVRARRHVAEGARPLSAGGELS